MFSHTFNTITRAPTWTCSMLIGTFFFLAGLILPAHTTLAAEDPIGCFSNGVTLSITVYRANGTTPVAGGNVQSGETVKYGATLTHAGGSNCNFEGGTLTITTPDGIPHAVASGAGIPLISAGSPFIAPQQSYVVSESDVTGGLLNAITNYANGISHTPNIEQNAQAQVDISNPYEDTALHVEKTAVPSFAQHFTWTINKSVTPAVWHLFQGDAGQSEYTVAVTKVGPVEDSHAVTGTITIHNPAAFASATVMEVTDTITGVGTALINCGAVTFPHILAPNASLVCTYSTALPDSATRTNTATVTTSGDVNGSTGNAAINFAGVIPTVTGGEINVNDTNGMSWEFDASGTKTYTKTFTCGADEGVHNNTATIVETQQSDDAAVTVRCYGLTVAKTAVPSFGRHYDWTIEKTADTEEVTLIEGQHHVVHYSVTVNASASQDDGWKVSGTITIHNPHPTLSAVINSVTDMVSPAIAATVSCPSLVVPSNGNLVCTYGPVVLPNGDPRTNTATATQQNHSYNKNGVGTPTGTTPYSGNAAIAFGAPDTIVDETITVTDSYAGLLGTVNAVDAPKTFQYERDIVFEGDDICGIHRIENIAELTTNDTGTMKDDEHLVEVMIECFDVCVNDYKYWKTHSHQGPGPYDNAWSHLGLLEENTIFYLSGQTWYQVLQTPPKYNVYYLLAHEYIAAKLNQLKGADVPPKVAQAIAKAELLFGQTTPKQAAFMMSAKKAQWTALIPILNDYNQGCNGPKNCQCLGCAKK